MKDTAKTRQQLIDEIAVLRRRVGQLEKSELQRGRAEEALRENEEKYRNLVESTLDLIFFVNAQGNYTYVNPRFERVTGYAAGELAGRPFTHVVAPEYIESTIERFRRGIRGGDTPPYEAELLHKSGERIPVEFLVTTRYDAGGQAAGRFGIGRDITERRKVEKTLREQREQLRRLAVQLSEAEEGERRRIARELHDQVGQNLTVVGINLSVLRSLLPADGMNPVSARLLEDSVTLVEQTTEYTRSLMSDLRPPDMDDYGLVAAIRWYSERFSLRTGVEVHMEGREIHPRPAAVVENNLFRIVQEALTNIGKHARAATVRIGIDAAEGRLRIRVEDDGAGFDPSRIRRAGEHHGWGLMTMAERAEVIGGSFSIASRAGQGTLVSVEVPL